jgi:hypothetical protein
MKAVFKSKPKKGTDEIKMCGAATRRNFFL